MKRENKNALQRRLDHPTFRSYGGLILIILVVGILIALRSPNFLTTRNILNILRQISVYGILAAGMAFVIITGGIDLSVGAVAGLSGAIVAQYITKDILPFYLAVPAALIVGLAVGYLNGFLISRFNIPPFAMTLGVQISLRGACYLVCEGKPIGNLPPYMEKLGLGSTLGIPTPIYFLIAVLILSGIILSKTTFGRSVYAVGGNPQAAFHAGINSKRIITMAYCASGLLSAIAGIILTARNASAQPTGGQSFETEAIAACVMGGIAMSGGSGSIIGVFLGALLLGIINNGMNLLYISSYWQMVIKGLIIIGAILYSILSSKKK